MIERGGRLVRRAGMPLATGRWQKKAGGAPRTAGPVFVTCRAGAGKTPRRASGGLPLNCHFALRCGVGRGQDRRANARRRAHRPNHGDRPASRFAEMWQASPQIVINRGPASRLARRVDQLLTAFSPQSAGFRRNGQLRHCFLAGNGWTGRGTGPSPAGAAPTAGN